MLVQTFYLIFNYICTSMEKIKNENEAKYRWKKEEDQEDRGKSTTPSFNQSSINNFGDSTAPINSEFDDNATFFEVIDKISGASTTEVTGIHTKDIVKCNFKLYKICHDKIYEWIISKFYKSSVNNHKK